MQHDCEDKNQEVGMYGVAVDYCYGENGKLWAGNDEYSNTVNFCPFCGFNAKDLVEKVQ